ncbi:MAG: S4 domain-containing protein [Alphaproteobacteria bacterium]
MEDFDDSEKLSLRVAEEERGKRLDHLLAKHFPDISRSRIKALIVQGAVRIDDAVVKAPAHRIRADDGEVVMSVPAAVAVELHEVAGDTCGRRHKALQQPRTVCLQQHAARRLLQGFLRV